MDYLRQGIYLRGYAQKQPKQEYKKEAFELFSDMLENVKREVVTLLARVRIRSDEEVQALEAAERQQVEARLSQSQFQHQDVGGYSADEAAQVQAAQQGVAQMRDDEDRPQRSVPVRQWQEVQALPRPAELMPKSPAKAGLFVCGRELQRIRDCAALFWACFPMPSPPIDPCRGAVITDARGRVLLKRRTENRDMAGLWEFPGGKRESGETSNRRWCASCARNWASRPMSASG